MVRIAEKIRSYGKAEKAKIEGRLSRDLQLIESKAYRTSQLIIGKGEAISTGIYARALSKDPRFYEFVRTMDAYKKSLKEDAGFLKVMSICCPVSTICTKPLNSNGNALM